MFFSHKSELTSSEIQQLSCHNLQHVNPFRLFPHGFPAIFSAQSPYKRSSAVPRPSGHAPQQDPGMRCVWQVAAVPVGIEGVRPQAQGTLVPGNSGDQLGCHRFFIRFPRCCKASSPARSRNYNELQPYFTMDCGAQYLLSQVGHKQVSQDQWSMRVMKYL